jgi:hypothetical protein
MHWPIFSTPLISTLLTRHTSRRAQHQRHCIPPNPCLCTAHACHAHIEPFKFTGIQKRVIPKLEKKELLPTSSHASRLNSAQDPQQVIHLENPEKIWLSRFVYLSRLCLIVYFCRRHSWKLTRILPLWNFSPSAHPILKSAS